MIDVRVALECQMTRRAAEMMTDAQLRELHDALTALEKLLDQPERYQDAEGGIPRPDPSRFRQPSRAIDHPLDSPPRAYELPLPRSWSERQPPVDEPSKATPPSTSDSPPATRRVQPR